jgi:RHS repeat-associated protein
VDQTFEVNPSNGTLSLNLPVHVTKSRNDFQPALKLAYNSGTGNGPFGIGWNISVDSITRKTTNRIPKYDESDIFLFSGMEDLVEEGGEFRYSASLGTFLVQRYLLRVENGERTRIERFTSDKDENDVFWRSISSTNVTCFFGRTSESRVAETRDESGASRIFSWLLCEVHDPSGNAMLFTYKPENDDGVRGPDDSLPCFEEKRDASVRTRARYLKSIMYGNSAPVRDMDTWAIVPLSDGRKTAWSFEVVFDYGEHHLERPTTTEEKPWDLRKDVSSTYSSGFELRSYRLCRRILMFHHFPKKLPLDDYLVHSYSFQYSEAPSGSLLESLTVEGHRWDEKGGLYTSERIAPYHFSYTDIPSLDSLQLKTMKPTCLQTLPVNQKNCQTRWIDLDGEGAPGLLVQLDGVWYYQRNENVADAFMDSDSESESIHTEELATSPSQDLGPVRIVNSYPTLEDYRISYFEDLDGNGHQDLILHDQSGRTDGYYEYYAKDEWTPFRSFRSILNFNLNDKSVHRLDLTGNGRRDVMCDTGSGIAWFPSLGKDGFGLGKSCKGEDCMQMILSGDPKTALYFVDMSGDGLADVLRIGNGQVSYCPNMGYGVFGAKIAMDNSPVFDSDDQFLFSRLHLLDLDGSGTTDMVYLSPNGEATAYINFSGNSWSDGMPLGGSFPGLNNISSVFTLDLLGKGSSCLCWAGPDGPATDDLVIRYLDLSGGSKPYLLRSWSNGLGLTIDAQYTPSTKFYHADDRNGKPWKTKLPFPVHTLSRLVEKDDVTGSSRTAKYRYHDGYFDGVEREFRGFGMVEKWEFEKFPVEKERKLFKLPTCYTKMWYHTGAGDLPLSPPNSETFDQSRTRSTIPEGLNDGQVYNAYRALKGKLLRSEVYGHDESSAAHVPFTVLESSYDILPVGNPENAERATTFQVLPRESITARHERQQDDAHVDHELILETNLYGDVTKAIRVQYGKPESSLSTAETRAAQKQSHITITQTTYTNDVKDNYDNYYKPLPASTEVWYIGDCPETRLLDIEQLRREGPRALKGTIALGPQTRTYYRSGDLTHPLELGAFECFSVVDQEFQLAISAELCTSLSTRDDATFRNASPLETLFSTGGYVDLKRDHSAWVSTPEVLWNGDGISDPVKVLRAARASFFVPRISRDIFGNMSTMKMDPFQQLPVQSIDPVKNITTAEVDYRVMQHTLITDPNDNRAQVIHDALGEVMAVAQMGSKNEAVGDSTDDVPLTVPKNELMSFIKEPSRDVAARLLGSAGSRVLFGRERLPSQTSGKALPTFQVTLTRTEHHRDDDGEILVDVTYFNGRGVASQDLTLKDWGSGELKWCVTGHHVHDARGNMVLRLRPYLSPSALFQSHLEQRQPLEMFFLDALQRRIGTLLPDHTWTKSRLNPWMNTEYDVDDNAHIPDPRSDPDVSYYFTSLSPELFLPSWNELRAKADDVQIRDAAINASKRASTPRTMYLDSRRNAVETAQPGEGRTRIFRSDYDVFGNLVAEFDGLGRKVQTREYDMLGRPIIQRSMDSGTQIVLLDRAGQVVLGCDSARSQRRLVYDALRRRKEIWVLEPESKNEVLWSKFVYGDQVPNAKPRKLLGRIFEVSDQSGIRRNVRYDFKGNSLSTEVHLALEYRTTLDWRQSVPVEAKPHLSSFTYDALNRAKSATDAAGRTSVRTWDLAGHLKTLYSSTAADASSSTCHISGATYAADGQPLLVDYGNSSHSTFAYDEQTRLLTRRRTWRDDGTVLEDLTWIYDCLGRILTVQDAAQQSQFFRNDTIAPRKSYLYDDFGRLVKATGRETIETGGNTSRSLRQISSSAPLNRQALPFGQSTELSNYTETYTYDDADNVLSLEHKSSDATISGWTQEYFYEEPSPMEAAKKNNRLSRTKIGKLTEQYGYDGDAGRAGCMTSMPGFSRMGWDSNGKLRCTSRQKVNEGEPETTWYVYDDGGRRVRKVVDRTIKDGSDSAQRVRLKETVFLDGVEMYRTYEGDGSTAKAITNTSVISAIASNHGTKSISIEETVLSPEKQAATTPLPTLLRYHVSASLETDDKAQVISYEEYNAFGISMMLACRSDVEAPRRYRFAAYRRDNETGLYACGARYYAPWLGRWTSPDPLGTADGHNVYAYVRNDPVNWADPSGTCGDPLLPKPSEDPKPKPKNAKVWPWPPPAKRRGGILDVEEHLKAKDLASYFKHEQNKGEAILNEVPLHQRVVVKAGGPAKFVKNLLKGGIPKVAGAVPGAGIVLGPAAKQLFSALDAKQMKELMQKEEVDNKVAAYKLGQRDMLKKMHAEATLIMATQDLSAQDQLKELLALMAEPQNKDDDEDKIVQEEAAGDGELNLIGGDEDRLIHLDELNVSDSDSDVDSQESSMFKSLEELE